MTKIIYTHTDEAPALATVSLLPILQAFAAAADVDVELRDFLLAGRSSPSSRTCSSPSNGSPTLWPSLASWLRRPRRTSSSCRTSPRRCRR